MFLRCCCLHLRNIDLCWGGYCLQGSLYLCATPAIAVIGVNSEDCCMCPSFHRLAENHIRLRMCLGNQTTGSVDRYQEDRDWRSWVMGAPQALLLDRIRYRSHQGARCSVEYPQRCHFDKTDRDLPLIESVVEKFGPWRQIFQHWTILVT